MFVVFRKISLNNSPAHIIFFFIILSVTANAQKISEYQLKAAFLFNFTRFLEWPPQSFASAGDPFIIGVFGPDPFGSFLDETVKGESVSGHPLVVQRLFDTSESKKCQILFINAPSQTADIIKSVKGSGVLTVSDDSSFCSLGGIIRFYTENDMVRLQINVNAANEENLTISSKLLRISRLCE